MVSRHIRFALIFPALLTVLTSAGLFSILNNSILNNLSDVPRALQFRCCALALAYRQTVAAVPTLRLSAEP